MKVFNWYFSLSAEHVLGEIIDDSNNDDGGLYGVIIIKCQALHKGLSDFISILTAPY